MWRKAEQKAHSSKRVWLKPCLWQTLILRLLPRQVGAFPDDIGDQLQCLSLNELENLADALFDFNHIHELKQLLEGQNS